MKINSNIKIISSSVVLVPYKKKHVEKYHFWMKDPELLDLTASEPLTLVEEFKMQESWFLDDDSVNPIIYLFYECTFIVLDKQTFLETNDEVESMLGDVNLYLNDQDDSQAAEIEVMIAEKQHMSKGKGKEALLLMMHYGADALKINRFIAKIKMKNERSIRLFRKIGFVEVNKSDFFQEVEMVFDTNLAERTLFDDVLYEIKEYS